MFNMNSQIITTVASSSSQLSTQTSVAADAINNSDAPISLASTTLPNSSHYGVNVESKQSRLPIDTTTISADVLSNTDLVVEPSADPRLDFERLLALTKTVQKTAYRRPSPSSLNPTARTANNYFDNRVNDQVAIDRIITYDTNSVKRNRPAVTSMPRVGTSHFEFEFVGQTLHNAFGSKVSVTDPCVSAPITVDPTLAKLIVAMRQNAEVNSLSSIIRVDTVGWNGKSALDIARVLQDMIPDQTASMSFNNIIWAKLFLYMHTFCGLYTRNLGAPFTMAADNDDAVTEAPIVNFYAGDQTAQALAAVNYFPLIRKRMYPNVVTPNIIQNSLTITWCSVADWFKKQANGMTNPTSLDYPDRAAEGIWPDCNDTIRPVFVPVTNAIAQNKRLLRHWIMLHMPYPISPVDSVTTVHFRTTIPADDTNNGYSMHLANLVQFEDERNIPNTVVLIFVDDFNYYYKSSAVGAPSRWRRADLHLGGQTHLMNETNYWVTEEITEIDVIGSDNATGNTVTNFYNLLIAPTHNDWRITGDSDLMVLFRLLRESHFNEKLVTDVFSVVNDIVHADNISAVSFDSNTGAASYGAMTGFTNQAVRLLNQVGATSSQNFSKVTVRQTDNDNQQQYWNGASNSVRSPLLLPKNVWTQNLNGAAINDRSYYISTTTNNPDAAFYSMPGYDLNHYILPFTRLVKHPDVSDSFKPLHVSDIIISSEFASLAMDALVDLTTQALEVNIYDVVYSVYNVDNMGHGGGIVLWNLLRSNRMALDLGIMATENFPFSYEAAYNTQDFNTWVNASTSANKAAALNTMRITPWCKLDWSPWLQAKHGLSVPRVVDPQLTTTELSVFGAAGPRYVLDPIETDDLDKRTLLASLVASNLLDISLDNLVSLVADCATLVYPVDTSLVNPYQYAKMLPKSRSCLILDNNYTRPFTFSGDVSSLYSFPTLNTNLFYQHTLNQNTSTSTNLKLGGLGNNTFFTVGNWDRTTFMLETRGKMKFKTSGKKALGLHNTASALGKFFRK